MKTLTKSVAMICAVYGLFLFAACEKEAINQQNPANPGVTQNSTQLSEGESLISRVDLGEKGYLDFTQFEDGEVMVSGVVSKEGVLPTSDPDMNPVALYKYVSGNDAPAELVKAYEATVKNHTAADRFEKELIGEAQSENTPQMSATSFQNTYCYSGWDYLYCWVNRTGTSYVQNYKFSMHANSSPYRGTIRHRLRYKSWGSWHTVRDFVVLQNQVSYIYSSGTWRTRESKVFEASGDGYHHSIRGTN